MSHILINGKYWLDLPTHRAIRPQWLIEHGGWEVGRIDAMISWIADFQRRKERQPMVFDIGTEEGDITALLAKYTKCDLMLFEPNERVLSCIKNIFERNTLPLPPLFLGFVGSDIWKVDSHLGAKHKTLDKSLEWSCVSSELNPEHGFKALHENYPDVPRITLDEFCERTNIYPDMITMDIEGAEFEAVRGAEKTLREKKPTIFMSVHPEFMYESYHNKDKWKEIYGERQHVVHLLRFIDELGYTHRCIEYDYHELHMVFEPKQ